MGVVNSFARASRAIMTMAPSTFNMFLRLCDVQLSGKGIPTSYFPALNYATIVQQLL